MSEPQMKDTLSPQYVKATPRIDISGRRFGTLTALEFVRTSDWNTGWRCVCDCGVERVINGYFLRSGHTTHCGCANNTSYTKEFHESHEKRGVAFFCHCGMMTRCFNQSSRSYPKYGARGITVCERWQDRKTFCADMSDRPTKKHSLHRVDNDKSYTCGICDQCIEGGWTRNVQWATDKIQARGRSSNRMLAYDGESLCMMDMAEKHEVSYFVLRNRVSRGWSTEDAIEVPIEEDIPIFYHGKPYSQLGLAREKGMKLSTLRKRLASGYSVDDAIDKPLLKKRKWKREGPI